mmetsp:Transcript_35507/g.42775  ORF Transcript_35507/g.42775 Transcript_35507/m.42775 type:complete len:205 (-) Transcript_35507:119-733(-)
MRKNLFVLPNQLFSLLLLIHAHLNVLPWDALSTHKLDQLNKPSTLRLYKVFRDVINGHTHVGRIEPSKQVGGVGLGDFISGRHYPGLSLGDYQGGGGHFLALELHGVHVHIKERLDGQQTIIRGAGDRHAESVPVFIDEVDGRSKAHRLRAVEGQLYRDLLLCNADHATLRECELERDATGVRRQFICQLKVVVSLVAHQESSN